MDISHGSTSNDTVLLTLYSISIDILTAVSLTSSIEWDDYEDILVTGTEVVRSEGVVCLNDSI